jgi:phosphohistidine phosphatase
MNALTLHILRHAKSSWDDPGLADVDRPLAPRGRKAAKRLARVLDEEGVRPQLVLCSPAVRATQTLERVLPGLGSPELDIDERLYHAGADELLTRLRDIPDAVSEALVVGHNPGLAELCLLLARRGADRDRVAGNLPTGAFVTLAADTSSWVGLEPGGTEIVRLLLPREI